MDDELRKALQGMEGRILAEMSKRFDEVYERIHDTETRLLKAFHGWATSTELKLKELPLFNQRLITLEDRLSDVERKLLDKGM